MKEKNDQLYIVALCAALAIFTPWIIDKLIFGNSIPSNISNEAWAGFLGSYIGGLCTMGAVFITIRHNNKTVFEQRRIQEKNDEEKRELSIRPYLDTRCSEFDQNIIVGMNDRVFYIRKENDVEMISALDPLTRRQIEHNIRGFSNKQLYINYTMRNVGAGSAVDMTIKINGFEEKIAVAKDETIQFLCMVDTYTLNELKFRMEYSDVEARARYKKEDIIKIEKKEYGCSDFSMIQNGKQEKIEKIEKRS